VSFVLREQSLFIHARTLIVGRPFTCCTIGELFVFNEGG
jgi:hypothetical protein